MSRKRPFIRLCDSYIEHPKFLALTEGAFCLWHEGMAFARKHQTDGVITFTALKVFRFFTKSREKQLTTPWTEGANPLWVLIPKTGYRVHDYLEWNPSKDEETERRLESKERMRHLRERRQQPGTPDSPALLQRNNVRNEQQTAQGVTNDEVLDRIRIGEGLGNSGKGSGGNPTASKRPIYQSDRFVVFEWQLDELSRTLGPHVDDFDLHGFFDDLTRQSRSQGLVIPSDRDARWTWLQGQVEGEARRRGLPFASSETAPLGRQSSRLLEAVQRLPDTR